MRSGVWPPNCTITPLGRSLAHDVGDVLEGERLEVQPVGDVVVGRDGLGVAVDHDGVVAVLAHGHGGVHAAVVELDALADAVGPAAEDDDALALAGQRLVFVLVGRVEVGRLGLELGGAGVDRLVDRHDAHLEAPRAHLALGAARELSPAAGRRSRSA